MEMSDVIPEHAEEVGDSWAQVLAKLEAERSKVRAQEVTGRGAKRKAAPSFLPKVSGFFFCRYKWAYRKYSKTLTLSLDRMVRAPRTAQNNPRRRGRRNFWIAKTTVSPSTPVMKARVEPTPTQWFPMNL